MEGGPTRTRIPRAASLVGLLIVLALIAAAAVLAVVAIRYLTRRSTAAVVERGVALLEPADSVRARSDALDRWDRERGARPDAVDDALVEHLYEHSDLNDQRVRLLLLRASNAQFADRRDDWRRWHENDRRIRAGENPRSGALRPARLELAWKAPVGLTAWFSTIIPIGGQVYVSSLGRAFEDPTDPADGVVAVDAASGESRLLFAPRAGAARAPRDIIGLAASPQGLFAASLNGYVYALDRSGGERWSTHVGSPIIAPPLAYDFTDDGVVDVIVMTRAGQVVGLSGQTGRTSWAESIARPGPADAVIGGTLALASAVRGQGPEVAASFPTGEVELLSARNGRSRWKHTIQAGVVSGVMVRDVELDGVGPPLHVGDRAGRVWALVRSSDGLKAVAWQPPAAPGRETLIAALRSLRAAPDQPAYLVACTTADYNDRAAAVSALTPDGVYWRAPIRGAVWGAPAIGDLNGDDSPDIVVGSIEPGADGRPIGAISVLSATGVHLARVVLDAPVESPPAIADIDGDNRLEVLVADQAGWLHCFHTKQTGPVTWGLAGGDSANTRSAEDAFSYGQTPFRQQWDWKPK